MAHFDVEIRDLHGRLVLARYRCPALNEVQAISDANRMVRRWPGEDCVVTCYRRRRGRARRLVATTYLAGGGGDGLAGVREPRRPRPGPGHLYAEAPLPDS